MTRLFLAWIAVVSALAVVPYTVKGQTPTPKEGALPKSDQVYIKIVWPTDPATGDADQPVVESWIAKQLKKQGQSKFAAATEWVPLDVTEDESTPVWDGVLDGKALACPVGGQIAERLDGGFKIQLDGWAPITGCGVTVSLTDEPGSHEIAAVERCKTDQGLPYVAVLIGPPRDPCPK